MTSLSTRFPLAAEHWHGASRGELLLPSCVTCGNLWFPPSRLCPKCLSNNIKWRAVSGKGEVTGWCVFHKRYFSDSDLTPPYTVVLVKLNEGPYLYSNYDDPTTVPDVGQHVVASFVDIGNGEALVHFRPQTAA